MQVWLHQDYRQFARLRQPGEIINVRDKVGVGLVARGAACPVVDGTHQCQVVGVTPAPAYLDEQLDSPVVGVMLPTKWSGGKRDKMRRAMRRSPEVRRELRGKDLRDIPMGRLR